MHNVDERNQIIRQEDDPRAYEYVADNASLARLCKLWKGQAYLALDTEFIRTSTFYPKVGLVQVCDETRSYLVDPLTIDEWEPFRALMTDRALVKILHSCSEDLLVFYSFLGVLPDPLFDTQIAAAFLDHGQALSYQNLVRREMGIDLPKGETRSDWLQRPLSEEQMQYAALDVAYLPEIYRLQKVMLQQQNKLDWFWEECGRSNRQYATEIAVDFTDYFKGIKGGWQLKGRQRAALQQLAQWREHRARERNKPRNWIVRDQQLLEIARRMPQSKQQLAEVPELSERFVRYEGAIVLDILQQVSQSDEANYPAALPGPLSSSQKKTLKAAQHLVQQKADALQMPTDLLARKKVLLALYNEVLQLRRDDPETPVTEQSVQVPEELQGWRKALVLDDLLQVLSS